MKNICSSISIWNIISILISCISAFSAYQSRGYVKKNYIDRQANFSLYLIKNFRHTSIYNITARKFLLFYVTITNKSDTKSSFKAELEIEYFRENNTFGRVILEHNPSDKEKIRYDNIDVFSNDIRVEERGFESKWLIFEQPLNMFESNRIEKYSVKIYDTNGNSKSIECSLIADLNYED